MLRESVPWKLSQAACSYFRRAVDGKGYSKDGQCLNQSDWVSVDIKEYSIEELLKFLWDYTADLVRSSPNQNQGAGSTSPPDIWGSICRHLSQEAQCVCRDRTEPRPWTTRQGWACARKITFPFLEPTSASAESLGKFTFPPPWKSGLQNEEVHRCQLIIKLAFTPEINTQILRVHYTPGLGRGAGGSFMDCYRHYPVSSLSLHCTQSTWM